MTKPKTDLPLPSSLALPTDHWHVDTHLVHAQLGWQPRPGFVSLSTPVHRASTVVFDSSAAFYRRKQGGDEAWVYGTMGTPTTKTLEHQITLSEAGPSNAADTCLAPSGLAAVTLVYLSLLSAGDHVLVPDNVYDPSRFFANSFCKRMGIEASFYDPLDIDALAGKFQSNTRLVWVESPGSLTFEVADLPAIAALARQHNACVAMDNTWSGGLFLKALNLGADVSVQALTNSAADKYVAKVAQDTNNIPATDAAAALVPGFEEGGQNDIFRQYSKKFTVMRPETPGYPFVATTFEKAAKDILNGADPKATLDQAVADIDSNQQQYS